MELDVSDNLNLQITLRLQFAFEDLINRCIVPDKETKHLFEEKKHYLIYVLYIIYGLSFLCNLDVLGS